MYSLPISTYSDYWRATKVWSSYLGGLAVLAAGTRYSVLGAPDITNQMMQPTFQQTTQSLSINKLEREISLTDPGQGTVNRGASSQIDVSRGVDTQSTVNQGVAVFGQLSQDVVTQETTSQETERISYRIEIVDQEIPYDTRYVESDKLLPGKSEMQEKGEKGISRQVLKTFEAGGQIIDQQVQSSIELKSPKREVVLRNSKPVPTKRVVIKNSLPTAEEGLDLAKMKISQTLSVESTAYTYTGNKTASGVEPRKGLIAVDPKVIAMGSKVYIEGYGYAIAADTGGAIRGNRIDVFFPTLRQCMDWGRRPVRIYVIQPS